MLALRRAQRDPAYRVYSEEEFFNGSECGTAQERIETRPALAVVDQPILDGQRSRRLAGLALLAAALGAVGGVIALAYFQQARHGARRARGHSHVPAPRPAIGPGPSRPSAAAMTKAHRTSERPEDRRARLRATGTPKVAATRAAAGTAVIRAVVVAEHVATGGAVPPSGQGAEFGFER